MHSRMIKMASNQAASVKRTVSVLVVCQRVRPSVRTLLFNLIFDACLLAGSGLIAAPLVQAHTAPDGEPLSTRFTVTAENQNVPVYVAKVAPEDRALRFKSVDDVATSGTYFEKAGFASFDCRGEVNVTVTCPEPVTRAKILPSRSGIVPAVSGNRVSFKVPAPCLLTLEINGDWVHSLHLFANDPENNLPQPGDPDVIYFGPGIHEIEQLRVTSGKTVYLADGAVVRGKPNPHHTPTFSLQGNDITLRGRGILDGSLCPIHTQNLLSVCGTNIVIDGITVRDSSVWTVPVRRSRNVKITNFKLFGSRANSDGIDICNSQGVLVSNCFLRTLDDLVVIKTDKGQGPAEDIVVKNCVLWNEVAHALSIGAELSEPVKNVRFSDCDVIHDKGREWTLRVFHCDSALISDVVFEDIRVEETAKFISLWIGSFVWSRDPERGHIQLVRFKNIHATSEQAQIELKGFDARHLIEDVAFEHVTVNGTPITARDVRQNEFVKDVKFR